MDIQQRTLSFPRSSLIKLSNPIVPSYPGHRLVSVKSEGAATVRRNLGMRKFTGNFTPTPKQSKDPRESHVVDGSSDESGAEDEHIVRIDSPSRLSFR